MPRPDTNVLVLGDSCAIGDFGRTFVTVLFVTRRITHTVTPAAIAFLLHSFMIFSLVGLIETTELQWCSPELIAVAASPLDPSVWAIHGA